jgi:hypothetical protein
VHFDHRELDALVAEPLLEFAVPDRQVEAVQPETLGVLNDP